MRPVALAVSLVALTCSRARAGDDDGDAYGARGTMELGGSLAFVWTDAAFTAAAGPRYGVFVIDDIELSVELALAYARGEDAAGATTTAKHAAVVLEPSYHPRLADGLLLLLGVGLGLGHDGDRLDLAAIPRVGVNFDLGGAVITPALRVPLSTRDPDAVFPGAAFEIAVTATW